MIVHALSVLSVQAQVSTYRFLSKNDISAVVALKNIVFYRALDLAVNLLWCKMKGPKRQH